MKKFTITRDAHTSGKKYVWYQNICLGYFEMSAKENKDIDWPKFRADKTLKIHFNERWHFRFKAYAYPFELCGVHQSEAEAAMAILKNHKERFSSLDEIKEISVEQ
jgi:hypothetical protein